MSAARAVLLVALLAVSSLTVLAQQSGQQCYDLQAVVLGRSGISFGNGTFGVLYDSNKQPIVKILDKTRAAFQKPLSPDQVSARGNGAFTPDAKLADAYSNAPDFPSFLEVRVQAICSGCNRIQSVIAVRGFSICSLFETGRCF